MSISSVRVSQVQNISQYQNLLFQSKLQILNDRLECYVQQVQNLKKTNSILLCRLQTCNTFDMQLQQQKQLTLSLRQQIQQLKQQLFTLTQSHQQQKKQLKSIIMTKDQLISQMRIQHEKSLVGKEEQLLCFRDIVKDKARKIQTYQRKIHQFNIQRLNTQQDYQHTTIHNRSTRSSLTSLNNKQNAIQQANANSSNSQNTEDKARQFMKKDKNQLKIMMKSLSNAQKCLQIGGQQLSFIVQQKDMNASRLSPNNLKKSKLNHTYYK